MTPGTAKWWVENQQRHAAKYANRLRELRAMSKEDLVTLLMAEEFTPPVMGTGTPCTHGWDELDHSCR